METLVKPKTIIVVACGLGNRVIGKDNRLPGWQLRKDMTEFAELTKGHIVAMGRKTFDSIDPKWRPLADRLNLIITRNREYKPSGENSLDSTFCLPSYESMMDYVAQYRSKHGMKNLFIIGGGEIYRQALEDERSPVDEAIVTEVEGEFEGDTFFPKLPENVWKRERIILDFVRKIDSTINTHNFKIVKYVRIPITA